MTKKLFTEKQYFNCLEIYLLISCFIVGFLYKIIRLLQQPENISVSSLTLALFLLALLCSLMVVLRKLKLSTTINEKYIKFKLYPLHKKKQKILLEDIESCKVISTPVVAQWHGGNISFQRYSSYTFNGRNGVFIKTKTDKAYFIGSNKVEQLKEVLEEILIKQTSHTSHYTG